MVHLLRFSKQVPGQQRPLRTPYKGKFLGSTPDLLNQKFGVWGPEPVVYPALREC